MQVFPEELFMNKTYVFNKTVMSFNGNANEKLGVSPIPHLISTCAWDNINTFIYMFGVGGGGGVLFVSFPLPLVHWHHFSKPTRGMDVCLQFDFVLVLLR
jgi:hypothetical protein